MAQDFTDVDVAGMTEAHGHFENAHQEFQGHLQALQEQRETLGGSWGGEAAGAFVGNFDDYLGEMNNVVGHLGTMKEILRSNINVYTQTHDETIAAARASGAGLPGLPI